LDTMFGLENVFGSPVPAGIFITNQYITMWRNRSIRDSMEGGYADTQDIEKKRGCEHPENLKS
jgi:hypothetical protein